MSPRLLNQTVTLRVKTYSVVAGRKESTLVDTSRLAAVQESSPVRLVDGGETQSEVTHRVYLAPPAPTIKPDDLVIWGTRVLAVTAPPIDMGGRAQVYRLDCREVR